MSRNQNPHLSFGGQVFHTVGFEEGEVDHGLEQGDRLLRVTGLPQEVAMLKEESWKWGEKGEFWLMPSKGKNPASKACIPGRLAGSVG